MPLTVQRVAVATLALTINVVGLIRPAGLVAQGSVMLVTLPTLAVIHGKDGSTRSGTVTAIASQAITIERDGSQLSTIPIDDIDPTQGVVFDLGSPTYPCSECEPVIRAPRQAIDSPQDLPPITVSDFQLTDARKGQAEIAATSPTLQAAAQACRKALCIVEVVRLDPNGGTMTVRYIPYRLN